MSRTLQSLCILVIIGTCLASWDGPVQTIEREETIPQESIQEHIAHSLDASNEDINDIRQNKIEPVLIVTASPKTPIIAHVGAAAPPTAAFSSLSAISAMFAVVIGFML
uniref:Secreted protein n=1 Tax=Panagrellus redivivus TaxID=6233 RepID=A0A7E4V9G1_PANRE